MVCRMALRKGFSSFRSNLLDFAIILKAVIASVVLVFFILAGILSASGNVEFSETVSDRAVGFAAAAMRNSRIHLAAQSNLPLRRATLTT